MMVTQIIVPAITFDVVTGIRLAVGVAWIVLVPAEFLGVTSGFGYTIEDARESLEYDHLMAMILVIGAVGYVLDDAPDANQAQLAPRLTMGARLPHVGISPAQ
jgi:NitT/TauT family transport system permease protein